MNVLKRFILYFVLINLLFLGIRFIDANKIIIEIEGNKNDFIQIFYKMNGEYSEQFSLRSDTFKNDIISFRLPFGNLEGDLIRIDPANKEGEISIKKITISGVFYTKTFNDTDLKLDIKAIQMISSIDINNGVRINSTGDDPVIELSNVNIFSIQNSIQFFISLLISFGFLFLNFNYFILKIKSIKLVIFKKICFYSESYPHMTIALISMLATLIVIFIFYPGFMTYDTLHALRSARNGVIDSMWPPMVSYIWRFVDLFSLNPSLMHFVQVYILFSSISFLMYLMTKRITLVAVVLLVLLIVPALIGTIAVIWKDVLMASMYFLSFLLLFIAKNSKTANQIILLSILGLVFTFIAICIRHNSIVAAVPFVVYFVYNLLKYFNYQRSIVIVSIVLGVILSFGLYTVKKQLDRYSLPDFKEMKGSDRTFIESVRVLDIAGASLCTDRNLFYDVLPNLTIQEIKKSYDPKHVNLSKDILSQVPLDGRINNIWFHTILQYPLCAMYNKFEMTKYMIGFTSGQQFLITDPSIIENEYGYSLDNSLLRDSYVSYIVKFSKVFILKPWFIYLVGLILACYLLIVKRFNLELSILLSSAIFYLGGLIMFGNAADARLPFFTNIVFIIVIIVSFYEIKIYQKEKIK